LPPVVFSVIRAFAQQHTENVSFRFFSPANIVAAATMPAACAHPDEHGARYTGEFREHSPGLQIEIAVDLHENRAAFRNPSGSLSSLPAAVWSAGLLEPTWGAP